MLDPARAAEPEAVNAAEIMELNQAALDSARAPDVIPRIRQIIASKPDSMYLGFSRQVLLRALVTSKASPTAIAAAADSAVPLLRKEANARYSFYGSVAQTLADRGGEFDRAVLYAHRALAECPDIGRLRDMRGFLEQVHGYAHLKRGNAKRGDLDSALTLLKRAAAASPDSQNALLYLGNAYEKKGKPDLAINAYIRSLAVFPGRDTTALEPLLPLYLKQGGSRRELDDKITAARKHSVQKVALDARRHERPAPEWKLTDLAGNIVSFSDFKGKVMVIDFWGSWCGPCRIELPFFQAMYERYRDRDDVVFIGMNWEREQTREARLKKAREFIEQNHYTFPVVLDHDRTATIAYQIEGFPTVFMIDKSGQIRYRNVGVSDGIEDILSAQVESLLE